MLPMYCEMLKNIKSWDTFCRNSTKRCNGSFFENQMWFHPFCYMDGCKLVFFNTLTLGASSQYLLPRTDVPSTLSMFIRQRGPVASELPIGDL